MASEHADSLGSSLLSSIWDLLNSASAVVACKTVPMSGSSSSSSSSGGGGGGGGAAAEEGIWI